MIGLPCFALAVLASPFKSKLRLEAENATLRHQLIVLRRRLHGRVRLTNHDRLFFIQLYRWFPSILQVLTIIRPDTLVHWHRAGFRCYWRWKSRPLGGRPQIDTELRVLIRRMSVENPLWQGSCDGRIRPSAVDALCAETVQIWSAPMAKLPHSGTAQETALRQAAVIRGMMDDLERTIQILNIDISTEEERVRVFERSDPAYSILARTLTARRDNLIVTVADLGQRLRAITAAIPVAIPEAA